MASCPTYEMPLESTCNESRYPTVYPAAVIAAEYEVEEAKAQSDVIEFTSDLVERGLLKNVR